MPVRGIRHHASVDFEQLTFHLLHSLRLRRGEILCLRRIRFQVEKLIVLVRPRFERIGIRFLPPGTISSAWTRER